MDIYVNSNGMLCDTGFEPLKYMDRRRPLFLYGNTAEVTVHLQEAPAAGMDYYLSLAPDRRFKGRADMWAGPVLASGSDPEARTVTFSMDCRTKAFRDGINGRGQARAVCLQMSWLDPDTLCATHVFVDTVYAIAVSYEDGDVADSVRNMTYSKAQIDAMLPRLVPEVGTVTTLPAGGAAWVEITGEYPHLVVNLGIPKGEGWEQAAQEVLDAADAAKKSAEGTDEQVAPIGLEHSAKEWALLAQGYISNNTQWLDFELNDEEELVMRQFGNPTVTFDVTEDGDLLLESIDTETQDNE